MLRFATWKIVSILMMTAVALLVIVPSMLPPETRAAVSNAVPKWIPMRTIVLGLDLQGGSHVLLEVNSASVVKTEVQNLRDDLRRLLRQERVPITGGIGLLPRGVQVRITDDAERARLLPKLQQLEPPVGNTVLGAGGAPTLDVKDMGNGTIQLLVTDAAVNDKVRRAVEQSIEVLRRRVDALGTTEPNIQRQGNDRILVEVPGLQNPERLKQILGTTAKLEFRLVAQPGEDPNDYEQLPQADGPGTIPVEKRVMVEGEDLTDAQPGFNSRTQEPIVDFRFNIRGGQRFGEVTSENVGQLFAIVLDGKVISAPRILSPITGGSGQISGHFTVESANNLAILLRAGALARETHDHRRAHRRPGSRPGFDRGGQTCRLCRRRAGARLYADDLRHFRHLRRYCAARAYRDHLRLAHSLGRDADAAGHRRHRADDRHGGRIRTF